MNNICGECGITANVLTCLQRYGAPPKKLSFTISTFHEGVCGVCGETKHVTEARDFFYPDFSLISKVVNLLKEQNGV